jgi:hypothetical protein
MNKVELFARRTGGDHVAAGHMLTHYRAFRARGLTASLAFHNAAALPATYLPGYADGYGPRGGLGAPWFAGRTRVRWAEDTRAAGLRFVGWADELAGLRHTGWHTEPDGEGGTLRGGVWQFPGRDGSAVLVPGYAEFDGPGEMNPGSAALALEDLERAPMAGHFGNLDELDETRDAARRADGIAETVAERERDYRSAYNAGQRAAERLAEALDGRTRYGRPLLADLRALRRSGADMAAPIARAALGKLRETLEAVETAREKRDSAWGDCWTAGEAAWREGYADAMGADGWNRFARCLPVRTVGGEAALLPETGPA